MSNDSNSFARCLGLLCALAAWSCLACSAVTRQVARDATPAAVDSGIQAGTSDKNQEALVEAIEPERVEEATEKLAAGAADGWTDAMEDDQRQARIVEAVAPVVTSLVDESMEAVLSEEHLARIRELAKQATLGFQDAIDEVAEQRDQGTIPSDQGNVLEAVDRVAEGGDTAIYVIGAIAVLLAVLAGAGVGWAFGRKRQGGTTRAEPAVVEGPRHPLPRGGMRSAP
jgi:hypothetical protein